MLRRNRILESIRGSSEKRWGSLSPSRRLLLNRRLIEAPVDTIDFVIVHELCHMAEPHHGAAFYRLLDRVMPDWAGRKGRLEEWMAEWLSRD